MLIPFCFIDVEFCNRTRTRRTRTCSVGTSIASMLNLSPNSVKSYCQRHPMEPTPNADAYCKQCGKPISFVAGKKKRQFCSDRCRQIWWNAHRAEVNRRTFHEHHCRQCGRVFSAYGKPNQPFCSRSCFAASRKKVAQ